MLLISSLLKVKEANMWVQSADRYLHDEMACNSPLQLKKKKGRKYSQVSFSDSQ